MAMTSENRTNYTLDNALAATIDRYTVANRSSAAKHQLACAALPGGNTRTVLHFDPFPLVMERGRDASLWDVDGHRYTDFTGEFTAGLFGHSNDTIHTAIKKTLDEGILLCAPNEREQQLAQLLCDRFPSVDSVRFCNSGTEANLMSITAARAYTRKSHILVFDGGYHGGVFLFGDGQNSNNAPYPFILGNYNSPDETRSLIKQHADSLAAVLVEPMLGTGGAIPAEPDFLTAIREACTENNVVLIFDEVMTSRISRGGLQHHYGVIPDMTSFGKYLGGGMTFGAFGGQLDIMAQFDPRQTNHLPHAGTFNNNVLTMTAGVTALRDIYTPEVADSFTDKGEQFRTRLQSIAKTCGAAVEISGVGSLMAIHFTTEPIATRTPVKAVNPKLRQLFHLAMLNAGMYMNKQGYMALMLPLMTEDYDGFASLFEEFLLTHRQIIEDNVIQ